MLPPDGRTNARTDGKSDSYIASCQKEKKKSKSVNTGDKVEIYFAYCNFPYYFYQCIKFHLITFNTLRDILRTKL